MNSLGSRYKYKRLETELLNLVTIATLANQENAEGQRSLEENVGCGYSQQVSLFFCMKHCPQHTTNLWPHWLNTSVIWQNCQLMPQYPTISETIIKAASLSLRAVQGFQDWVCQPVALLSSGLGSNQGHRFLLRLQICLDHSLQMDR